MQVLIWILFSTSITQLTIGYPNDVPNKGSHISKGSDDAEDSDAVATQVTIFPEGVKNEDAEATTSGTVVIESIPEGSSSNEYERYPILDTLMDALEANLTAEEEVLPYRASCECGRPARRIVGGVVARISDYPWTAALTRGGSRPYCGGTLIADRIVVTASHCVDGMSASSIRVVLNQQYVSTGSSHRHSVTSIQMHPSYDRRTVNNDIALLHISPPVRLGRTSPIVPACVVGSRSIDFTGTYATVVGFGATSQGGPTSDVLRKVTVPVISNAECNRSKYSGKITGNMLCAGLLRTGGKDSCQGDSGGPLLIENGGRRTLIGIVSWGYGCAQPNSPGVYTKVQNYGDWILRNSQGSVWCSG